MLEMCWIQSSYSDKMLNMIDHFSPWLLLTLKHLTKVTRSCNWPHTAMYSGQCILDVWPLSLAENEIYIVPGANKFDACVFMLQVASLQIHRASPRLWWGACLLGAESHPSPPSATGTCGFPWWSMCRCSREVTKPCCECNKITFNSPMSKSLCGEVNGPNIGMKRRQFVYNCTCWSDFVEDL